MEKKTRLEAFVKGAGQTAKDLLKNAERVIDQNADGKFDLEDVSVIAGSVGDTVKRGAQFAKDSADEQRRRLELKLLAPIFQDSLDAADFLMPKFIRVTDRDKKHAESDVCQGSIGYTTDAKDLHVVHIFKDSLEYFGLTFYPDSDCEFYYVDPSDRDRYIALDEYFNYLKIARVNELEKIAQDLGAKHFKVTYKEEQTSFSEKKVSTHAKVAGVATADTDRKTSEKKYSTIDVASEMQFPGHEPIKPQLKYLQREPSIQNLIALRMDKSSPLLHRHYTLEMSTSSGMKESDAIKIDAVLKGLKCTGNTTVASEARNEARRYLEYEIDF